MKRFVWTLPFVAVCMFFCLPALAVDAIAAKIVPEPDVLKVPWWLPLVGVLIAGLRTAFSSDTVKFPWEWAGKWRAVMVAVLAAVGTLVEQLIGGFDAKTAVLTLVMLGLPSIVQEILKAWLGAAPTSGGGAAPKPSGMFPSGLGVLFGLMLCASGIGAVACAAKPYVCPVLKIASDLCQKVVVEFPDGTREEVPVDQVAGLARNARAVRLSGDGGAPK